MKQLKKHRNGAPPSYRATFFDFRRTAPSKTSTFERISGSGGMRGSGKLWASLGALWEGLEELWEALYIDKLLINRTNGRYVKRCGLICLSPAA